MEPEYVGNKFKKVLFPYRLVCLIYFIFFAGIAYGQKRNLDEPKEPIRIGITYRSFGVLIHAENGCSKTNQREFKSKCLSDFFGTSSDLFFWQGGSYISEIVECNIIWPCSSEQFITERKKYDHYLMFSINLKQNDKSTMILTDTLLIPMGYEFSLDGQAVVNDLIVPIVCVGMMNECETFFEITSIYHITTNGICEHLPLNTEVIDCPVPINYINETEEIDNSGEGAYRFGIKGGIPKKRFSY